MRRGIACTAFVAALGWAGTASAATLCVPNNNIPACHGIGANELKISDAITNANDGDTIFIGAGTYNESPQDTSKKLTFIGAGPGKTVIQGQGSPAMAVASGSSVWNLTVNLYNAPGETGLQLAGSATDVSVTATEPMSATDPIGVALNGGSFAGGTVSLPLSGSETTYYAGVVGPGNAERLVGQRAGRDRRLGRHDRQPRDADRPSHPDPGQPGRARRGERLHDRRLADPDKAGCRRRNRHRSIEQRHLRQLHGATCRPHRFGCQRLDRRVRGLERHHRAGEHQRGPGELDRPKLRHVDPRACGGISGGASTTVTIRHTFYDPSHTSVTQENGGVATIAPDSHSGNFDPLFVNAAAGDLHLQAGSPGIDHGATSLAAGESSTDLDGRPRLVVGHRGDAAISDVGAYEFVPHAPSVHASASVTRVPGGKPVKFSATGSDPSPGDVVSFVWRFDDGAKGAGAAVSHAFVKQGKHTATLTATDLDGFTATATVSVTVTGPAISKLKIKPGPVRAGHGAKISYRDSQAARTTFKVFRVGSRHAVMTFTHRDHAGSNSLHFKAKKLARGRYRLQAVPKNRAGSGRPVSVKFRIV